MSPTCIQKTRSTSSPTHAFLSCRLPQKEYHSETINRIRCDYLRAFGTNEYDLEEQEHENIAGISLRTMCKIAAAMKEMEWQEIMDTADFITGFYHGNDA